MTCPSLEELLGFINGSLERTANAVVEAHLSGGCLHCRENHSWLVDLLLLTARDDSFEFPEETIRWSVAQFKAMRGLKEPRPRLVARLIFDTLLAQPALEVRSAALPMPGRQMLFQAETYDVDLRMEGDDESATVHIIGQIMSAGRSPSDLAGLPVRLVSLDADPATHPGHNAITDVRGMFRLRSIAPGTYDLIINVSGGELSIDGIICRTE